MCVTLSIQWLSVNTLENGYKSPGQRLGLPLFSTISRCCWEHLLDVLLSVALNHIMKKTATRDEQLFQFPDLGLENASHILYA